MITPLSKVIEINFNLTETINTLLANARTGKRFNTADTDAWFEFGFTDANIQNGTFNLTLINLKDESKFEHEGIAFNSNPFYYKLDSGADMQTNEIKHAGTWIGQLVVTLANGKSATQKFMFDIESHILDGTVASVTMLEGYSVLMAQIENAKELLDQYNIDYAALLADLEAIYYSRLLSVKQQLADIATLSTSAFPRNVGETEDGPRIRRMFSYYDTTNKKVMFKFDEGAYTLTTIIDPPSNCALDFCKSLITSNILTSVFEGIINIYNKENIEIFGANIDGNIKSIADYTNLIATNIDIPAIYIYCSKNIRVHDNTIENVANSFVQINSYNALSHGYGTASGVDKYSKDIKIHDNKLKNSWYDTGIAIFGGCVNDYIINSDTTKNVDVYGNEISYVGLTEFGKYASRIEGEGIELDNGTTSCDIYHNEIHHCMTGVNADDGSTDYSINDNNIHDCDDGISLYPKFNMSNTGILINNQYYICKDVSVVRNKISNVANIGISLLHGSVNDVISMRIKDNIIDGCKDGLNLYEAHYDSAGNLITTGLPSVNDVTSGLIDNLIVDGNVVRNASKYALNVGKILHGSNIRIRDNFLDGVIYDIRIDQCTGITYDNNLLKHGTISDNSTMPTGLIGNKIKTIIKTTPPTVGAWNQGDLCINPLTYNGQYEKFVCSTAGTPGTWQGINQIGFNNLPTSSRPATGIYRGYYYFDTTLNKFCYYNGTAWTDAMGKVV